MVEQMDPQVTSSIITAAGTLLGGGVIGRWFGRRSRSPQDQRCERVCAAMLSIAEPMVAVFKALGIDDHRLSPHIDKMETVMAETRAFLNQTGG